MIICDCSESVLSSPAPELSPSSCPPAAGRFELLQQPVSDCCCGRGQQKLYYYDYGGLDNSSNSYGGNGQIAPNNNNNQNNNNNCIEAMAPLLGGVVRRSYPRAGRRPAAGAAVGPDGDCPQRSKRSNLKKTAHNRSTPASPSPVVPLPVGAVHERYSSLSTAGAIDAVQPYLHNNNTASSSSTASAHGSNTSNSNKTMASNGSGGTNKYHNRNQQAPLQYAYGSRRRPSPSFYTPLAGLAAVGGAAAVPRSPCSFGGDGGGDRSGIVMQQLPQHRLPYSNNYRRGGSMRYANVPSSAGVSMYEAYVGTAVPLDSPRTAFPALIDESPQQRQQQQPSATARRSLLFDCSAASAIRLSSHSGGDNGTSATETVETGGDCGDRSQTAATAATTAFRPRVGTTNETMLGMFV
ncbi:hypothetical protein niasHT_034803 [Heterodera trifolii]|uniref:Uncharacterized protein n=1 Tax=Heterodera trifolii TaxID=157864 RepID=A0ABD2I6U1_9BILA